MKDVIAIGNALLDTLVFVDDTFLENHKINKGAMELVDSNRQKDLLEALQNHDFATVSGGSAANTMHGISLLGGSGSFIGKTADDEFGKRYSDDLASLGIELIANAEKSNEEMTGSCLVLVSSDGERSMLTHLGISSALSVNDFALDVLDKHKILYIEGYMWDAAHQKEACIEALKKAKGSNVRRVLTFSDPFCVGRFRDEFKDLVKNHLDLVFCNKDELLEYIQTDNLDDAIEAFKTEVKMAFVTNSEKGCIVLNEGTVSKIDGFSTKPIDTTGAGDAFAAGVLYALAHEKSNEDAASLGNYLGSKIVQRFGARLHTDDLADLNKS